jgi:hypothetical protein
MLRVSKGNEVQYKIIYKDGSVQIIEAASYTIARGTCIFNKEDGSRVSILTFSEVRSITKLDQEPAPVASA